MSAQPTRLVAAVFGADLQDAKAALERLKAGGVSRSWLVSPDSPPPPEARPISRTLLAGEQLIIASIPAERLEESVERLTSVGAPAVFVLPDISAVSRPERVPPGSGHSLSTAIQSVA